MHACGDLELLAAAKQKSTIVGEFMFATTWLFNTVH